jgi:hypothetical protein
MILCRFAAIALLFGVAACVNPSGGADTDDEPVGETSSPLVGTDPVSAAVTGACSTTAVKALATQLVEEIQCMRPNTMKKIDGIPGLALGAAVFPYLQTPAADALINAQKARGVTMSINSGLRTLPQQYLLYRWAKSGLCGISIAAAPGTSNHESALAVDINDNAGWLTTMQSKGFTWLGTFDPVHFDYTGGGAIDLRGLSVKAFQRLWNRNHPADLIAEDGAYGPATETRLTMAPIGGFPKGATCNNPPAPPPPPPGADAGAPDPATPAASEPPAPDAPPAGESATTTSTGLDVGTPVSRPYDQTNDGCSAAPLGATGSSAGFGALLWVGCTTVLIRRRRRRCANRAENCAPRA